MSEEQQQPAALAPEPDVSMADVDRLLQADQEAEQGPQEAETDEPVPEQPAEGEHAPEADQDAPEEPNRGDLRVPLREERERRRQAEQRLEHLAQQQRVMSAYLEQIARQINPQPQQQAPQVPDFEVDPAAHLRHQVTTLQQTLQQVTAQQQQSAQQQAQERQYQAAQQAVVQTEAEFAKQRPDYYDAVDFMRGKLKARFSALGVPEEQVEQAVAHDMRQFGLRALMSGSNPAEKIYQLAKLDGYSLSSQKDEAAQKLAKVAAGAAASRGARSSAPATAGELTPERAAGLSYKEFGKLLGSDDAWERLMKGA